MTSSIAVVGAGVAGLSCARVMADAGLKVVVFEQASSPGGRVATRRTELGGFDIGAQYFTRDSEPFGRAVDGWIAAGVCAPWGARVTTLGTHGDVELLGREVRLHGREMLVGTPAMSSLALHLAAGLDVRYEQRIRRLEAMARYQPTRWTLKRAADPADAHSIEITEGIFDAVVVAVPPPLAAPLLDNCPELLRASRATTMEPCFALLLGFGESLELPYDAGFVDSHRLAWLARDSGKPQRRPGERWVAHAHWAWSREHLEDDPDDVRQKLVKAFGESTGIALQPIYSSLYCWLQAAPAVVHEQGPLWNAELRLGACGDWCSGARVEAAWTSGAAMAHRVLESLGVRAAP